MAPRSIRMSRVMVYFFRSYCWARRSICCLRCSSPGRPLFVLILSFGVWADAARATNRTALAMRIFLMSVHLSIVSQSSVASSNLAIFIFRGDGHAFSDPSEVQLHGNGVLGRTARNFKG